MVFTQVLRRWVYSMMVAAVAIMSSPALFASTSAASLDDYVPNAALVGKAEFKVMFFTIYEASLFAPNGEFNRSKPFALRINYLVDADKSRLVDNSISEMKRQKSASGERLERWEKLMNEYFFDIKENDIAYMVHNADRSLTIWTNDQAPVTIEDKAFARAFLNIWVGRKPRDEEFQSQLFGQNQS